MASYEIEGDAERGFTIKVEKQNLYVSIPVYYARGSKDDYSFIAQGDEPSGVLRNEKENSLLDTKYFLTVDNQGAGFVDVGIPEDFAKKIERMTEKLISNKED
jgi:hypothetical protein